MSNEKKGIDDPWRRRPAMDEADPQKVGAGLPGSDHALDWDIMPDIHYTLRVPRAIGALTIHGANTLEGAVIVFLRHVENSDLLRKYLQEGGFRFCNTNIETPTGYVLHTPDRTKALYHSGIAGETAQVCRLGFSRLVRLLLHAGRRDARLRAHLNQLGIVPLLT